MTVQKPGLQTLSSLEEVGPTMFRPPFSRFGGFLCMEFTGKA